MPQNLPELQNFIGYLRFRRANNPIEDRETFYALWSSLGNIGILGVGAILAIAAHNPIFLLLTVVVAIPISIAWMLAVGKRRFKVSSSEAQWQQHVMEAVRKFKPLLRDRKMIRRVDPVAAQLAEASAFYWQRIHTLLEGPFWSRADLTPYLQSIRREILGASDQAMDEVTVHASHCIGDPSTTPSDDFNAALSDLGQVRINQALSRLATMATDGEQRYRHRSSNIDLIFPAARTLAEKLQGLCDEVERLSDEVLTGPGSISATAYATGRLDSLISNLQSVRAAQAELETDSARVQQGQRPL